MASKSSDWRPGPTVCRCCFADGCYKDISTEYFWMGKREVYSEMLSETFDLNIAYSQSGGPNSNSRLICEPCISRLRDASDFKRQVQECEKVFVHHLDSHGDETEAFEVPVEAEKEVKVEMARVKEESKLSDDDFDPSGFPDDDDDDLDDEPLTKLASKIPKKESGFLMDLLAAPKPEKRKSTSKTKAPPKKMKKKEGPKPSSSVSKPPAKTDKKKKGQADGKSPNRKINLAKQNAKLVLLNSTLYPFKRQGGFETNSLVCPYCKELYRDPADYRRHIDEAHKTFSVNKAMHGQEYVKVDCTNVRCRLCPYRCETIEDIANHLVKTHKCNINLNHEIALQPHKLKPGNWVCCICDKKLPSMHMLCRHTSSHYLKYTCEQCGKSYLSKENLKHHVKLNHSGSLLCRKCWKRFSNAQEKSDHLREVPNCRPFLCGKCGERFVSWESKYNHLVEAHNVPKKPFKCSVCDLSYPSRTSLFKHFKVTHSDDAAVCPCCGLKFDSNSKLKDHLSTHTGARDYQCGHCQKTFTMMKNLKQHMWIHSEYKRFTCPVCVKKFTQKVSLKVHMNSHHPDIEFLY